MKTKKLIALAVAVLTITMAFVPNAKAGYLTIADFPQKQEGAHDGFVRALQTVIKYNHNSSLANDGVFGSNTTDAVESYQHDNGLVCDGIVGTYTWGSLNGKLHLSSQSNGTYYYKIRKPGTTVSYTNTVFFKFIGQSSNEYQWLVYKAASGNATGQWYNVVSVHPTV